MLDAADLGVNSVLTTAEGIADTQAAVSRGNEEPTKSIFEESNEEGCPLN